MIDSFAVNPADSTLVRFLYACVQRFVVEGGCVMNRKADERLQHQLEQKLLAHGMRPPCRVTVNVRDGVVTVSGIVQHDYQKNAAIHACRATSGVRMVVNNLQSPGFHSVWSNSKEWDTAHPSAHAQPNQPHTAAADAAPSASAPPQREADASAEN
jgi:hypothetical protein